MACVNGLFRDVFAKCKRDEATNIKECFQIMIQSQCTVMKRKGIG